jgi:hypothetical protein
MASHGVSASVSLNSAIFKTLNYFVMEKTRFVIIKPFGVRFWILMMLYLWTRLRVSFNAHIFDPCCYSSDLPGVNPATNDRMILYYRLMTKVDWFRR